MDTYYTPNVKWAMNALISIDEYHFYEYGYSTPLETIEEFNEILGSAVSQHPGSSIYLLSFIEGEIIDGTFEGKMRIADDSKDPRDWDHDPDTEREVDVTIVQVRHRPTSVLSDD